MDIKAKYNLIIIGLIVIVLLFIINLTMTIKSNKTEEASGENQEQGQIEDENPNLYDPLDPLIQKEDLFIIKKDTSTNQVYTDIGDFTDKNNLVTDKNLLTKVTLITKEQEIVGIGNIEESLQAPIEFRNILIKKGENSSLDVFIKGIEVNITTIYPLSKTVENLVGDIKIEEQKIVSITVKPDVISGKVLLTGKDFIEIEGYGKVPIDEDYATYKIYGDLSLEPTKSILVGYDVTDFVVSNGKINAALIKDKIKADNIRVLILTNEFKNTHHNEIKLTSDKKFKLVYGEKEKTYEAGKIISISTGDKKLKDGRIKIEPISEKGKIEVLSINRLAGNPMYRGVIEIAEDDDGLFMVNELSLEEYLYAVIPSEMPTSYGVEALKVQAICARSYAYKQLYENKLKDYGAHVDDSISYQVYNNVFENEESILAVKDTYGKVIEYEGNIITAFYFSTSCGHTTSVENVWGGETLSYLQGRLMVENKKSIETLSTNKGINYNKLDKEENFRDFINNTKVQTYDSEFEWYRWNLTMSKTNIEKVIEDKLRQRYNANPNLILTQNKDNEYESIPVDSIGEVKDIKVLKRGEGGIITELLIKGSKKNIKVLTEYNIRTLLAPLYDNVERNNGSKVSGLSLLPSAFFVIDKLKEDGKVAYKITGGGYGHGVGMSQNGVKAMVDKGLEYDKIIKYFYKDTEIGNIYN